MRLRRRQAPADEPGVPATAPDAPLTGPVAAYARVLDGDSLWLAVTGTAERVGLRQESTGEVVEPPNDAPPVEGLASYRWHLPSALPDLADELDHDVFLLVTLGSGTQVRAEALPSQEPMRTPPTRDGRWQLDVRRREGGAVVVRRERRGPVAEVVDLDAAEDGVRLTFTDPGLPDPRLVLAAADEAVRHEAPVTRSGDLLTATLAAEAVPDEVETEWFVSVASAQTDTGPSPLVPLVRARNDTTRPGFATVLPILWTEDDGVRRTVRLRYQQEGRLRAHRPEVEDGDPS